MTTLVFAVLAASYFGRAPGAALSANRAAGEGIVTVEKAVSDLSAELGRKVWVAPELRRHLVLLRRNGQPASVALDAISTCLRASLLNSSGGQIVTRVDRDMQALRADQASERAKNLGIRLSEVANSRTAHLNGRSAVSAISDAVRERDREWKDVLAKRRQEVGLYDGRELMPCEVLLEQVVKRIGLESLAKSCAEHSEVFEDIQIPDESQLPACDDLVAQYDDAITQLRQEKPASDVQVGIANTSFGGRNWFRAWLVAGNPVRHLRLRVKAEADHLMIDLEAFDEQGDSVDAAELDGLPLAQAGSVYFSDVSRLASQISNPRLLTLEADGAQACHFFRCDPRNPPAWVRDPDKYEPLDLFVLPALNQIAGEDRPACVAIDVSDELWYYGSFCQKNGEFNVDTFKLLMCKWGNYEHVVQGSFAVWRPKYFDESEARQADRKALAQYAQAFGARGGRDFVARCRLLHDASPAVGALTRQFAGLSSGKWEDNLTVTDEMSRLVGAVSPSDWDQLTSGRRMRVSELNVVADLESLLREDQMKTESGTQIPDLLRHPSELFRNQTYGNAVIEVQSRPNPLFRFWESTRKEDPNAGWSEPLAVAALGRVRYEGGDSPGLTTGRADFDSAMSRYLFTVAQATRTTIVVRLTQSCYLECKAPFSIESTSSVLRYDDLPQALRDQLWDLAAALAQRSYERRIAHSPSQNSAAGAGGQGSSPPP